MSNQITDFRCRSCGAGDTAMILSLGSTPLANALLTSDQLQEPEERFPLDLVFCRSCSLVQITEDVPPEKLFREYFYLSSFSETMLKSAEEIATRLTGSRGLGPDSRVVEVASNDGYLLQYYKAQGIAVLGIEPATNIAEIARYQRGIDTMSEFFSLELAETLASDGIRADVIHANNVLAHVPDLNGVIEGFARLLTDGGLAVIEVPYLRDMIEGCEFDTIYHEHLCYFSLSALDALFSRHGLRIVDVERLAIHGGTLRIFAVRDNPDATVSENVRRMLSDEEKIGMRSEAYYSEFGQRVERLRRDLLGLLKRLKSEGNSIAVYGASAKGSTLLNYFGIGSEMLDYVVDRSTVKQGMFTPGTHLPIMSPERLLEDQPDYVLLLTWNFAAEILKQQAEYLSKGGHFIIPIPELRIVANDSQPITVEAQA